MKKIAPETCPSCGSLFDWKYVGSQKAGFSYGKAAVGTIMFGAVGAVAGLDGKKQSVYRCSKCGYSQAY